MITVSPLIVRQSSRLVYLDNMKAGAIIMVVILHSMGYCGGLSLSQRGVCTFLFHTIAVPVFFLVDGYLATLPGMQGAFAEGDTVEEALFNCVDVVKLIFEYRKERGEELGFNTFSFNKSNTMTVAVPIGIS